MDKFRKILCIYLGHSNIVSNCMGYISCGRCRDQIGDALGGVWSNELAVGMDHGCKECRANFKRATWKDRFLLPKETWDRLKESKIC